MWRHLEVFATSSNFQNEKVQPHSSFYDNDFCAFGARART